MHTMVVRKLSVALEESLAARATVAARRSGVSLSAWVNAAAELALAREAGFFGCRRRVGGRVRGSDGGGVGLGRFGHRRSSLEVTVCRAV